MVYKEYLTPFIIGISANVYNALIVHINFVVYGIISRQFIHTGTNVVSGTSEFLPSEPPVRITGDGTSSLERNRKKNNSLIQLKR